MTFQTTEYRYIQLDDRGAPFITGTTMKVVELVEGQIAHGWSPKEIQFQHPYLTMSQIHSALAYYWDHKPAIDADLERRFEYAEQLRQQAGTSPLAARLRAQGLIK